MTQSRIGEVTFMKDRMLNCQFIFIFLMALLCSPASAIAGSDLKLVQTGSGVYSLQGTSYRGVAGTDVVIQYDKTLLGNPRITWGNLAAGNTAANTSQAGQIHIAAVDVNASAGTPGTGTFATITFDVIGKPAGNITANTNLIDINGASLATPVSTAPIAYNGGSATTSATDSGGDSVAFSGQTAATVSSGGSGTGSNGNITAPRYDWGTISMDGNTPTEKKKEDPVAAAQLPEPAQENEKPAVTANTDAPQPDRPPVKPAKASERRLDLVTGVLGRFRQFQGEKSPKALLALFKNGEDIVQEPSVALSDGSNRIKLFVGQHSPENQAPNFILKGAKLISVRAAKNSGWVIELLPDKGVYDANVTVSDDSLVKVIPLTVAPSLPAKSGIGLKGKLTEADFNLFLKKRGTDKAPRFDLNGDGKRDYIDDYIFTANFIAKNGTKNHKVTKKNE